MRRRRRDAEDQDRSQTGRRAFLRGAAAACAAGLAALTGRLRPLVERFAGPRERDLSEADIHGPHDLAG